MVKRFCDRCGKELATNQVTTAKVKVFKQQSPVEYSNLPDHEFNLEFCSECANIFIYKMQNPEEM